MFSINKLHLRQKNKYPKYRDYNILQLFFVAGIIGIITGILSIVFNASLAFIISKINHITIVDDKVAFGILPIIGGFILCILYRFYIDPQHRKFGVDQVFQEMKSINQFIMKPKQVLIKMLGTIITLGTGLSAGKQGPIVHIGGSVGSNIGYYFNFKRDQVRILIACGVAGALSSAFNEPIFASVFVLEVLLKKDYLHHLAPVFIASIVAALMRQLFYQDTSFIEVPFDFSAISHTEFPILIILGIVCGIVAGLYIFAKKKLNLRDRSTSIPFHYLPLIAGVIVAMVGYFLPEIFDLHVGTTLKVLSGSYGLKMLLMIIISKILLTAITLGFGGLGGGFMPGVLIGAATGGSVSMLLSWVGIATDYSTYAFLGIIGVFSGFASAPLSATLMAIELSGNKDLLIPIFLTSTISAVVTETMVKQNIYIKH